MVLWDSTPHVAQVTNPDNPNQGNDRHGHQENRQHDTNDGGLLDAVFSVD